MTAWCRFGWGDGQLTQNQIDDELEHDWSAWQNDRMGTTLSRRNQKWCDARGTARAIIHVIGIYCGVPQALECMRAARNVIDEEK